MKNLNITNGIFFSQRVLLELISKGVRRDKAYKLVQKCAIKSLSDKCNISVKDLAAFTGVL